jgi:prepilin-type N-terminal cleavage/methylation domain-containing protein
MRIQISPKTAPKNGFIKTSRETRHGWTLVEMMIAVGLFSIVSMALMGTYIFSVKSMASMYNYTLLDEYNRQAMDQLTRDIRQAKHIVNYTTNSITILAAKDDGSDGPEVTYAFSPSAKKMIRSSSDGTSRVLLNDCSLLSFQLFTRCPSNGVFGSFPVAINNWSKTAKVLQLTWKTSIALPSGVVNSENIQTARVVIRKQQES